MIKKNGKMHCYVQMTFNSHDALPFCLFSWSVLIDFTAELYRSWIFHEITNNMPFWGLNVAMT